MNQPGQRVRREPPPFRRMRVIRSENLTPHLAQVTFGGAELDGLETNAPAASVRLLIPPSAGSELVIPTWNGNEFLLPGGERPHLRTFTPRRFDPDRLELDLQVVLHEGGGVSAWSQSVTPGAEAALSGTGRGYQLDATATAFVLIGDETALPAIAQIIEMVPSDVPIHVLAEVRTLESRVPLPAHPGLSEQWVEAGDSPGATLVGAAASLDLGEGTNLWAAGEAAAMHQLRQVFLRTRGMSRSDVIIRGYWKYGR